MDRLRLFFILVALSATLSLSALSRSVNLTVKVTAETGEALGGQYFLLEQTDYSLTYGSSETVLDADGKCTVKAYAGNHRITLNRSGYATLTQDFNVTSDMTVTLTLKEAVRNPFAFKTKESHDILTGLNDVRLSWNREDPVFFDDFESYEPFAIEFSPWTGIDGDHAAAAPLQGSYPNRATLQYAQIINPLTVEPSWWSEYPVLRAYSGKQYAGFVRTSGGSANDDWLISPAVTIGTDNIVRFMAKAADVYKERFEVGITTVDNPDASDFDIISSGNYESVDYSEWHAMQYDLSAYAGETVRIAIHYIGDPSNGGAFMLMVDDFFIGQADYYADDEASTVSIRSAHRSPANPNERFYVYKDGVKVAETDAYHYDFSQLAAGTYSLGVKAVYKNAESDIVSESFKVGSGEYYPVVVSINANDGETPVGETFELLNKTTTESYNVAVTGSVMTLQSVPAGDYVISLDADRYGRWSEEVTVDKATQVAVNLVETITDPYNITVSQSDNEANPSLVDAEVRWNQDLGFSDSFEDYDDFATTFGDWTSIDNDRRVVYPIALGTQSNIVDFPGASTTTNPAAITPMVFNPYQTQPAMAPTDQAVIPPTGEKSVIFFSPQQYTADKWLISPAQDIRDGYEWSFAVKAYSNYPETFELCIAASNDYTAMTVLDRITPSYSAWQSYSIDLSAYAGQTVYVALHYVSNDAFFAQVDDFYVGPRESTSDNVGNVQNYQIYLDNALQGTTSDTGYTLKGISRGEHTVGIRAVYKSGSSSTVEYTFNAQGAVTGVEASAVKVAGGNGCIRIIGGEGIRATVVGASGQQVAAVTLTGDTKVALAPGFYVVAVGGKSQKVIVR